MSPDTPPPSPRGNKLPAPERDRLGELLCGDAPSQFVFAASCDLTAGIWSLSGENRTWRMTSETTLLTHSVISGEPFAVVHNSP